MREAQKRNQYNTDNPFALCLGLSYGDSMRNSVKGTSSRYKAWELHVAALMVEKGYAVYLPVTQRSPCDLIAIGDGKVLRVEVTKGYRLKSGKLHWPPHNKMDYDLLAIYEINRQVTFFPLFD